MNALPKAAIYARISRDDAGDSAGVTRQEEDCRALAARRGWDIAAVFVDNDVSAYSGRRRPQYERLLEAVRSKAVDAVVAYAPERLHRSPRELEDFIELVEQKGTHVETVKAGAWDVSSSHGRLVSRMLGAVARAESERTGERVSRAHQQALEAGLWRGAAPYGFTPGKGGLLEVDEEQAAVVKDMAQRALKGDALTRIASDLNKAGIRPRRGTEWTNTGVRRLLSSPALGGLVQIDGELRPAAFPGILSSQEWRTLQAAITARPITEKYRPREALTLLGGIIRCAEHDVPCMGSGNKSGRLYQANAPGKCTLRIGRVPVDAHVRQLVIERLSREDAAAICTPPQGELISDSDANAALARRAEIAELFGEGLISRSDARKALEGIASTLGRYEAERAPSPIALQALVDPEAAWEALTMPQRREVVRLLFEKVEVEHAKPTQGPRVDLSRLKFTWRV